jgi:hypothetical protein
MKIVKNIICWVVVLAVYSNVISAQNLTALPKEKRDSILIATAEEVILKYDPEYYRNNQTPLISYSVLSDKHTQKEEDWGKGQYSLLYFPDVEERLDGQIWLVCVQIWAETSKPAKVTFNNGVSYNFDENEK